MIRLLRVSKRYGERLALDDLTLSVAPGEVLALVGPNGAGKSTALKIAVGLVRPGSGRAAIDGYDLALDPRGAHRRLGYLPQHSAFPEHVTCGDALRLVATLHGIPYVAAQEALARAGLADRAGSRIRELSGGQRQRLALALAGMEASSAFVLDEPSISLDAEGAEIVRGAIAAARARGAAVLLATHHLHDVAAVADRVAVLRLGRLVAEAGPEVLRRAGAFEPWYHAVLAGVQHAA